MITCFCYVLMILLLHKKVRFSYLFQMCSKSIFNDIGRNLLHIRWAPKVCRKFWYQILPSKIITIISEGKKFRHLSETRRIQPLYMYYCHSSSISILVTTPQLLALCMADVWCSSATTYYYHPSIEMLSNFCLKSPNKVVFY